MENKSTNIILLNAICSSKKIDSIYFPRICTARWWITIRLYKTFSKNEDILRTLASKSTSIMEYKEKLISNQWWSDINNILKIISSIYHIILVCERDNYTLSMSYDVIKSEKEEITKIVGENEMNLKVIDILNEKLRHINVDLLKVRHFFTQKKEDWILKELILFNLKRFLLNLLKTVLNVPKKS